MRDRLDEILTVTVPGGMCTGDTVAWLGNRVLSIICKQARADKAYRRELYRIVSSFLKRADLGVRYWDLLVYAEDNHDEWRFIARRDGQWLPIILNVMTCEQNYRNSVLIQAISDSAEALPYGELIFEPIPGSSFSTLHFGTPEEEARRNAFIERRKVELIEQKLVEYPLPFARVSHAWGSFLRISPWTDVTVYLDVPEVTPALINDVSIALGRNSELLGLGEISRAIKAVLRGEGDMIDSPAPPGYASWPEYLRMLYRANRFLVKPESDAMLLAFINGARS